MKGLILFYFKYFNIFLSRRFGVEVNDFGNSWRDGWAFLAIIHRIRPGLVNIEQLQNVSNLVRLETAFRIAETELGIARLLDPEGNFFFIFTKLFFYFVYVKGRKNEVFF